MWKIHLVAVLGLVLLCVGWLAVQLAWRRVMRPGCPDPDVLAARGGCGDGGCSGTCNTRDSDLGPGTEEEWS